MKVNNRLIKETVQEEHISIVAKPGSLYFGHITVKTDSAWAIFRGLYDFIIKKEISKSLIGCEKLGDVKFQSISFNFPKIDAAEQSSNQIYPYNIVLSISNRILGQEMVQKNSGKLTHSSWLTTANRNYVATRELSDNLRTIAEYIVKICPYLV